MDYDCAHSYLFIEHLTLPQYDNQIHKLCRRWPQKWRGFITSQLTLTTPLFKHKANSLHISLKTIVNRGNLPTLPAKLILYFYQTCSQKLYLFAYLFVYLFILFLFHSRPFSIEVICLHCQPNILNFYQTCSQQLYLLFYFFILVEGGVDGTKYCKINCNQAIACWGHVGCLDEVEGTCFIHFNYF